MKRLISFSFCACLIVLILVTNQSMAGIYCVSDAANLIAALNEAKGNGSDDVIKIQQGTYYGNFVYASLEAFNLNIEGGYTALCAGRVVNPANTVLDGGQNGIVLVLSSPNEPAIFVVEGITLQNGDPGVRHQPGGLYALTNIAGEVTLKNNTIRNNSQGGVKIKDVLKVNLTKNTISANNSDDRGGGIYLEQHIKTVTLTENIITNNSSVYGGGVFSGFNTDKVILTNNTITNNSAGEGGGVHFEDVDEVICTNNIISNNSSERGGGGVSVKSALYLTGTVTLINNTINNNISNRYDGGGGVGLVGVNEVTLINNVISYNSANNEGGGIKVYIKDGSTIDLINNTISNNSSGSSGGGVWLSLFLDELIASIYNNIIWNNNAVADGADIYINNDLNNNFLPSTVNLYNNDFDQSSSGIYIQIPFPIDPSNLDNEDPLFVDPDNGDFHLTVNSPCIDAGAGIISIEETPEGIIYAEAAPGFDIDGDSRPRDNGYDIGADEYPGPEYWTDDRMRNAVPPPMGVVVP